MSVSGLVTVSVNLDKMHNLV